MYAGMYSFNPISSLLRKANGTTQLSTNQTKENESASASKLGNKAKASGVSDAKARRNSSKKKGKCRRDQR
jgi:hypothetical protein